MRKLFFEEVVMKSICVIFIILLFMTTGCGPKTRIQKTYINAEQVKTGAVDAFNSFDEVGRSYVAT